MRYHYEQPDIFLAMYGEVYECDHPVYDRCTLYLVEDRGLAVIQQRFDSETKSTFWTEIDPGLVDSIYTNERFMEFFDIFGRTATDGLYPTVTVRQIMWALKMKPLKRERWETTFDHKDI